ncbi:MAG TPA: HupE/UreJ family protein [Chthoniobacterales bacterium]
MAAGAARFLAILFSSILFVLNAAAHDPGLSSVKLTVQPGATEIELTMNPADLDAVAERQQSPFQNWPASEQKRIGMAAISLIVNDVPIAPKHANVVFESSSNVTFHLTFPPLPASAAGSLRFDAPILARLAFGHRMHVQARDDAGNLLASRLLSADTAGFNLDFSSAANEPSQVQPMPGGFYRLGAEHVLTGFDHLLFLFATLIVCQRFSTALTVITSFTLAHSLTLALATLGFVRIPGRLVEIVIAASIVYVALENLLGKNDGRWRWALTFVFGLVHGLGFASALAEYGIGSGAQAVTPLLLFNLGVEAGQIGLAALVLPLLWRMRQKPAIARVGIPACSIVAALLGGFWLVERSFS